MKTIHCWRDFERYGITCLTGEACGLSYRILFDLTVKGQKIVEKCLGCKITSEPWNRGTKEDPHTASIMLSNEMMVPLGVFTLLENDCSYVCVMDDKSLIGFEPTDVSDDQSWRCGRKLLRVFDYGGTAGSRNTHVMSGRVE